MMRVTIICFYLVISTLNFSFSQVILPDVNPCSDKVWSVPTGPILFDTTQVYSEAVANLYLQQEKIPITPFPLSNSQELGVSIYRESGSGVLTISSSVEIDKKISEVYANFKITDYDFSNHDPLDLYNLYELVFADSLGLDIRDICGYPEFPEDMPNSHLVEIGRKSFNSNKENISRCQRKKHLNPVVINPELNITLPTRPRAFVSSDSSMLVLYIFTAPDRRYQLDYASSGPGRCLMRILITLKQPRKIEYMVVPAGLFGRYGFEFGGCFENAYF